MGNAIDTSTDSNARTSGVICLQCWLCILVDHQVADLGMLDQPALAAR